MIDRHVTDRLGIRARVAVGSFVIAALLALAAGLIINAQIARIVRDGTIHVLHSDTAPYLIAIQNEPGEPADKPGPDQLIAVLTPAGKTEVSSLPRVLSSQTATLASTEGSRAVSTSAGQYVVLTQTKKGTGGTWTVIAARPVSSESVLLGQMRTLLVIGLSVMVVVIGVASWLLTAFALAPVRRLRDTADRLSQGDSDEMLPVSPARDDITALALTLNRLIGRLRDSARREKQLVSDASHELRTPLAIARTQFDVAVSHPTSTAGLLEDLRPVSRSIDRLEALTVSLLELSRLESEGATAATSGRRLVDEVDESVERLAYRFGDEREVDLEAELHVRADLEFAVGAEEIGRVVENLVVNSVTATDGPAFIRVSAVVDPGGLTVRVADRSGGMPLEFVPHALERFRRADDARSRGGAGLGLSIVTAIVRRAGGTIELDNSPGTGLTVVLTFPALDATPAHPSTDHAD